MPHMKTVNKLNIEELENDRDYFNSEVKKYRRWYQEKNDFDYHNSYTFTELSRLIETSQASLKLIEDQLTHDSKL